MDLVDEKLQHLLGDGEVGDDPILQRANDFDIARGASQHPFGFFAHGGDPITAGRALAHRTTEGFVQDNPLVRGEMSVLAVPRSMERSFENKPRRRFNMTMMGSEGPVR